jgi:Lsr2
MPTLAYQVSQENGATVAQKIQAIVIDDLDGGDADGTVRFGLDGTEYEIDLNAGHCGMRWRPMPVPPGGPAVRPGSPPAAGAARRAAG